MNGYLTNPQAAPFAQANPELFEEGEPARVAAAEENGRAKFSNGKYWQFRWPTEVHTLEAEWARFKAA